MQQAISESCRELYVKGFESYKRLMDGDDSIDFEINI